MGGLIDGEKSGGFYSRLERFMIFHDISMFSCFVTVFSEVYCMVAGS